MKRFLDLDDRVFEFLASVEGDCCIRVINAKGRVEHCLYSLQENSLEGIMTWTLHGVTRGVSQVDCPSPISYTITKMMCDAHPYPADAEIQIV